MRIALITTSFFPQVGGAEFVVHHLASQWVGQGHEVCVFKASQGEPDSTEGAGYSVKSYPVPASYFKLSPHWQPFSWYVTRGIGRQLERFRPEFISAHFGYPVGAWLSQMRSLPRYVVTCHGRELTTFDWGDRHTYKIDRVLARALNASAGAVAISTHARRLMLELGVEPGKIVDIPNGVDVSRFAAKVKFDLRGRLGIAKGATVILSVGREHPQKAYDAGLRAFGQIAAQNPEACYVILGKGAERWRFLVAGLGLQGRVVLSEFHGDELIGAYQQADIFFSPSIWELMPLVVLEAMAAGLPMVATNVSGSQDLVRSGDNGFLVEPGDTEQMAQALQKLLREGHLRRAMGAVNLSESQRYSWEQISRRYLDVVTSSN